MGQRTMGRITYLSITCTLLLGLACQPAATETETPASPPNTNRLTQEKTAETNLLKHRVDSLCQLLPPWLTRKGYRTDRVLVADLQRHSGLPRMVLVNPTNGQWIDSGLVAHGSGAQTFAFTAVYSNKPNSYCSSQGRYRIGQAYTGNFGKAYKLHGLDPTNNNAYQRLVVLHQYRCVPEQAVYPDFICNSLGCPMVSPGFLQRLFTTLDDHAKPMLLWVL